MCPMGAIAIYLHWLHDYYKLAERVEIDWTQNSSWRKVLKFQLSFGAQIDMFVNSGSVRFWSIANKVVHRLESV
jgi:hypothetical protein